MLDPLSEIPHQILKMNSPAAYESLLPRTPGNAEAGAILGNLDPKTLLAGKVVHDDDAELLRGALYLWHDYLPQSHTIFQGDSRSVGSFWHAIMHRREGDFSNSKHWYARCTDHPALPMLAVQTNSVLNPLPVDKSILKLTMNGWNPDAFVDLVQEISANPADHRTKIAIVLQKLEWRILFDHTARTAIARDVPV